MTRATGGAKGRARRGQSTVEYVLLVSVLVIGLLVAAYAFVPAFSQGAGALEGDITGLFGSGTQNGAGDKR